MKVTDKTITDAQIKELQQLSLIDDHTVNIATGKVLFNDIGRVQAIREARARCADSWNKHHVAP